MNTIEQIEAEQVAALSAGKNLPDFSPGDTLRVNVKVIEGNRERLQAFEGVCIGRRNAGLNSSFTVRKISYGEGVERVFPLFSPKVESITVIRRGKVRRAKLYYLRGRRGKSARIAERTTGRAAMEQDRQAKVSPATQAASAADMSAEELEAAVAPPEEEPAAEPAQEAETPEGGTKKKKSASEGEG